MPHQALHNYLQSITKRFAEGNATEHTYRGDLQVLVEALVKDVACTNEPKRSNVGAPDYIISRKKIPIGYIEAKDIGENLEDLQDKEQLKRYRDGFANLIFTDYLEFRFYKYGKPEHIIRIAEVQGKKIVSLQSEWEKLEALIVSFCAHTSITIKSAETLAVMMAAKAKLIRTVFHNSLEEDLITPFGQKSELLGQYEAFKQVLIHDITPDAFADLYAQTIAYGMFAARLNDPTLHDFTREEAAKLIPQSNPFLRKLFQLIAQGDLDKRLAWILDDLAEIFVHTDVDAILKNFGRATRQSDPIIHFYETFLKQYDRGLRKDRGVWYTPQPVVNFIVRAVDDILKTEFGIADGLASSEMVEHTITGADGKPHKTKVHRVQVLDPATGTGTFLAETIKHIHESMGAQGGLWTQYVDEHLIPRLHGFELLMASYAMCHLKLEMLLRETGYKESTNPRRLSVYLTNSLDEQDYQTQQLPFAQFLTNESEQAKKVKRDTPVMVVMGNPPYNISSSNKSDWILELIQDYKKGLKEKTINALSDDYVKFIRYAQHFIERSGQGMVAMITNNQFLDGVIFNQMRKSIAEAFDKIYIYNLHGNAKIKEKAEDGSKDENVFDIQPGVSISLFIRTKRWKKENLASVLYLDSYGKREEKFKNLLNDTVQSDRWVKFYPRVKDHLFKDSKEHEGLTYDEYYSITELFQLSNSGIEMRRDLVTVRPVRAEIESVLNDFLSLTSQDLTEKYNLPKDTDDWQISKAKQDIIQNNPTPTSITYRPFDNQYTLYTGAVKGFMGRPSSRVMNHLFNKLNVAFVVGRQGQVVGPMPWNLCFISNDLVDRNIFYRGGCMVFPLYLYPTNSGQIKLALDTERTPNLNEKLVTEIAKGIGLKYTHEKTSKKDTLAPIDLLDYIYAVLHSPAYREKYKEFLKIDFPRIPRPKDKEQFWQLVALGGRLRKLHLLEDINKKDLFADYPVAGSNTVAPKHPKFENERVFINSTQYFGHVPKDVWEHYIGGYQPAQKWLKDRQGRTLNFEDVVHYQKMVYAMRETRVMMIEIDYYIAL